MRIIKKLHSISNFCKTMYYLQMILKYFSQCLTSYTDISHMKPLYDRKFHIPVIYRFLTFLSRKFRKYFDCISSQPLSGHKNNIDSYTRTIKIIILRKESWNYDGQQLNQEAAMVIEVGFTTTNVLMQSVPITTKFVSLNPTNGEVIV
jgi:hypothetical protein